MVRDADWSAQHGGAEGRVPATDPSRTAELHRTANFESFACPVFSRRRSTGAARRPASLHSLWRERHAGAGRPDAGGLASRIAGRQLLAGRRQQGYMGAARMKELL